MTTHIRHINPPTLVNPGNYSQIVETTGQRTIYISGQVALDAAGNVVGEGDFRAQTQQTFLNIQHALEAAGATFNDVVKLTYYLRDMAQAPIGREVRDEFIDVTAPPASMAVEVSRLFRDEFLIEIEAIAVTAM